MRKFQFLATIVTESAHYGTLEPGQVVECDTVNDTPDGGVPSEYWREVDG